MASDFAKMKQEVSKESLNFEKTSTAQMKSNIGNLLASLPPPPPWLVDINLSVQSQPFLKNKLLSLIKQ